MSTWDTTITGGGALVYSNGNLTATNTVGGTNLDLYSNTTKSTGKWTFSVVPTSTGTFSGGVGLAIPGTADGNYVLGSDAASLSYFASDGSVQIQFNVKGSGEAYLSGNTIWIAVDIGNNLIWVRRNAGNWNNSGTANPDTGTGGFSTSALIAPPWRAAAFIFALNDTATINFTGSSGLSTFTPWDGTGGATLMGQICL